jgi:hypothetical protein
MVFVFAIENHVGKTSLPAASATPEDELPTITLPTGKNALPVEDMVHEDEPPSKLSWY